MSPEESTRSGQTLPPNQDKAGSPNQPSLERGGEEQKPTTDAGAEEDDVPIEGGAVSAESGSVGTTPPKDPEPARQLLAYLLLALLVLTIVGHYIVVLVLQWNGKYKNPGAAALTNAFNTSLPVVSGLVSAAVTYYFAREQQRK